MGDIQGLIQAVLLNDETFFFQSFALFQFLLSSPVTFAKYRTANSSIIKNFMKLFQDSCINYRQTIDGINLLQLMIIDPEIRQTVKQKQIIKDCVALFSSHAIPKDKNTVMDLKFGKAILELFAIFISLEIISQIAVQRTFTVLVDRQLKDIISSLDQFLKGLPECGEENLQAVQNVRPLAPAVAPHHRPQSAAATAEGCSFQLERASRAAVDTRKCSFWCAAVRERSDLSPKLAESNR